MTLLVFGIYSIGKTPIRLRHYLNYPGHRQKILQWCLCRNKMIFGVYDKIKKCSECHPKSSYICKNASRRTPRPQNFIFLVFWGQGVNNGFRDHMTKLKNVWNVILKVLTYVRTHPEELLVQKISFSCFLRPASQEWRLGPYDKIEKCLKCHPESSYIHKNFRDDISKIF